MREKRLIDADALISNELIPLAKTLDFCHQKQKKGVVIAIQRIKNYPTVDAVEVVRCKDCKHLTISACYGECSRAYLGLVSPDDFCSRGERSKGK